MVALNKQIDVYCEADEKITTVVAYSTEFMAWGSVVTKERIRVSTWLRTNAAPESVCLFNAMLLFPESANSRPMTFPEIHIPIVKIAAFHIMPPASDPIDYDANEINRKMDLVTAIVGSFRMDGKLRISQSTDLKKYLEISRENYTPLYEVTISHPSITQMNLPKVNYVLVRQNATAFAHRLS